MTQSLVAAISRMASTLLALCFMLLTAYTATAASYERTDVTFTSQGLRCAAWYYVPIGLKSGEKRPAIVMAHGFTGVKEMYLDGFAKKFAEAGMVVLVFDYRYFGGSEGEPRAQLREDTVEPREKQLFLGVGVHDRLDLAERPSLALRRGARM